MQINQIVSSVFVPLIKVLVMILDHDWNVNFLAFCTLHGNSLYIPSLTS